MAGVTGIHVSSFSQNYKELIKAVDYRTTRTLHQAVQVKQPFVHFQSDQRIAEQRRQCIVKVQDILIAVAHQIFGDSLPIEHTHQRQEVCRRGPLLVDLLKR